MSTEQMTLSSQVEMLDIATITNYPRNPRAHDTKQIELIAKSIDEFGWTNPILVDEDNRLICGHGRVEAARLRNKSPIPAIRAIGWTEGQKAAYVIADNQIALQAGWDEDLLRQELDYLRQNDTVDLALLMVMCAYLTLAQCRPSVWPPPIPVRIRFLDLDQRTIQFEPPK